MKITKRGIDRITLPASGQFFPWDADLISHFAHGGTSVVMGNCGVGIAPCRPKGEGDRDAPPVNVEAVPYYVDAG